MWRKKCDGRGCSLTFLKDGGGDGVGVKFTEDSMYIFWIKWKVCVWVLFHRLIKPPVRVKRLLLYKPTCVLMVNVWILFTACLPKRNDQHIYETMYTYYDMISRLYLKALESSSLKQACTRQTSTSVSTHSSPSKFTLEKVSTCKSTSKATKVVCLCS